MFNPSILLERAKERFTCKKCGRDYKQKQTLQRHLKYECGVAPQFQCPMCPYSSNIHSNLKQHIKRIHNSASSCEESDTEVDDEMKDACEDDSDCSDDVNGNKKNLFNYLVFFYPFALL